MADSLVYKLQNIKEDRNTNLKPENLKAGVTCLGIEGTLEPNTGSDVEPIYVTSNYTVKTIPVDLNETIDSISTYEDYVAVHTTLNKLKVYNKSDLSTPFITKDNVIPYNQGCYYIYGFEDNKLYITNGFNGSSTQDYYRIDLSKNTITHATYTDSNRLRNSGDLNINMTNNIVHFKHGSYLSIYSYDLTTGFTELSDEYNAVNSYIGNNVYEDLESIVIIQSNGSKTKHRVIPSGGEGAICGVNFTKTKAFLFMSGSDIVVYSLNDDYSMNEMLSTVSLPITFDDGIPKLQCLNSNYYYLSYKNNNYILNFDEETNQFSIVLTNENLIVRNSLPYIENENQYIDFEQGSVEIGITYNNKQYLTRDKYSGYTNTTLLSGHTMYDIAHQLVSGTMPNNGDVTIEPTTEQQTKNSGYYNSLQVNAVTSSIDSNIKPENIKKDVSILGVTGTYDVNQVENQVKVFETEELMNSDTNPQNGNLALVYRDKCADLVVGNTYTKLYIPNTITFDSAITSTNNIVLDTGNSLNSPSVGITTTAINFYRPGLPPQIVNTVQYSSTDGITYTRTDELKEELTIEEIYNEMYTQITIQENNYELLNQMFKGFDTYFGGLYVYKDDSYLLASTQLDAIADNVCLNNFYGKNGIEIGTLQNTTNLSKDQLKTRIILFNKFNKMTTSETNLAFAFSGLDIKSAPLFDTSNVTEMEYMYEDCTNLVDLPLYDTTNVINFYNMVNGCPLSNDSLNNLMLMAVNCNNKSYNGNKTLKTFGLTKEQVQICTTLSNYQAFLDAGWTTGY